MPSSEAAYKNSSPSSISLDTILSAIENDLATRCPELRSTKRWRLARYILMRLYEKGQGNLRTARFKYAQTSLARWLGISLRWVHELTHRLVELGWLAYETEKLPDGTNGSCIWRIGPMIQRMLIALERSSQRKSPIIKPTQSKSYFSPLRRVKEILRLQAEREKPPTPEEWQRWTQKYPEIGMWKARGEGAG